MKSFIKNNLKVFVTMIITTIIVGSVSVYAATHYLAKDITFTPTNENFKKENGELIDNVEDALNQLYNNSKEPDKITTTIGINGTSAFAFTDLIGLKYKKVKYISDSCAPSNTFSVSISSSSFTNSQNFEKDKEYVIGTDINRIKINKTSGNGWCQIIIELYN